MRASFSSLDEIAIDTVLIYARLSITSSLTRVRVKILGYATSRPIEDRVQVNLGFESLSIPSGDFTAHITTLPTPLNP
ncbi:MAG: hypothetical protein K0S36_2310 [Nitrosospira multiformis]|jgi:hypothetical protein|nr:hypothetical protein [Nitrosospira multiformis]